MKRVTLCALVFAFIFAACHSDGSDRMRDALAALKSNAPNPQYSPAFWRHEYQRKTDLWQHALDFCSQPAHQDFAACQGVLSQMENSSSKLWMGRGTSVPFGLQPQATASPRH